MALLFSLKKRQCFPQIFWRLIDLSHTKIKRKYLISFSESHLFDILDIRIIIIPYCFNIESKTIKKTPMVESESDMILSAPKSVDVNIPARFTNIGYNGTLKPPSLSPMLMKCNRVLRWFLISLERKLQIPLDVLKRKKTPNDLAILGAFFTKICVFFLTFDIHVYLKYKIYKDRVLACFYAAVLYSFR